MEASCLRHTGLPHTTRLFADFAYEFERVARFYAHDPAREDSYKAAAAALDYPDERRAALVAALRQQSGPSLQLDLLAQPGAVAVATGQQVGLFSGPCYTVYKALTAVKLAQKLTGQGIPTVPVFWLATEDHDFAEVSHCWVFGTDCRPVRLAVDEDGASARPVGEIAPQAFPTGQLRACLEPFPFAAEVISLVEESYSPGRALGAAFRRLLERLLPACGILYLDPMQPAVRALAAPLLARAVEAVPDLINGLLERSRELEAAGYHAQVQVEPESSLLFLLENGRRVALRRAEGAYLAGQRRLSAAEVAARAGDLSPNALLRPLVQDFLLPTVASVCGPAEVAYLAQSEVLYRALLGRMPVCVPRRAFTLVDTRSARLMRRYGLNIDALFHGEEALRERIAQRLVPPALERTFQAARAGTLEQVERLRTGLAGYDATLAAALDTSRAKILYQLSKIERKAGREALRRNERAAGEAGCLHGLLYPNKRLQERLYTILPFLAKHGLDLPERLYENVHLDCPDHVLYQV